MRITLLDDVTSDMILGKSVYTYDGKLLLSAGMKLLPKYVNKLQILGLSSVYIIDPEVGQIELQDLITERTRLEAKLAVNNTILNFQATGKISDREVKKAVNNIMDELLANRHLLAQLTDIKSLDESEYVFSHSVNVCVLALMTGISVGYNQIALQELGTGALLHDLGKIQVPKEILNKSGSLTQDEFEEVKRHCDHGWQALRDNGNINTAAAAVAFQHHEHFNGQGYPRGLKGWGIHEYARIVAIADVYDALTSDRIYRQRFLPHEAAEYLQSLAGHQFDPALAKIFLENIAIYPPGTKVLLNNGKKAVVIACQKDFPTRPKLRLLDSETPDYYEEINMAHIPTIFISKVLD